MRQDGFAPNAAPGGSCCANAGYLLCYIALPYCLAGADWHVMPIPLAALLMLLCLDVNTMLPIHFNGS
jgi:hypothetical protein